MKSRARWMAGALLPMLLAGCKQQAATQTINDTKVQAETISSAVLDTAQLFSERDFETAFDKNSCTSIKLNGQGAECSANTVDIADSTITIRDEGIYLLSGTLENGSIVVEAEKTDKVRLVLDGASISSSSSAALYVKQADKVFVTLAEGTQNSLSNGGEFIAVDENNIDAAVFAKDDLTLNGAGALAVESPAGHGIVCKDDLVITGGNYSITAANQGLSGKQSVRIADGSLTITAGKDGIHAENLDDATLGFVYLAEGEYKITAEGDGISASNVMQIDGGDFTLQAGGGSQTVTLDAKGEWGRARPGQMPVQSTTAEDTVSQKGIKAMAGLCINGGSFEIDTADDALHANADLTINGGEFQLATGDDGLHADQCATVAGGSITITKSYEGIEGQNITISGGTIDLVASDDGLNAAGGNDGSGNGGFGGFQQGGFDAVEDCLITISGGELHINAAGDGIDSNGNLTVTGGQTYISGPTSGADGALDYNGEASISGGIVVATGSVGMAQNFSESSTQGAMLVSISGAAGDTITLADSSGKQLIRYTADKDFACVVLSCPEIKQGEGYTVTAGNSTQQITMDSLIYGQGGMGGRPGGGGKPNRPNDMGERPGDMGTPPDGMGEPPSDMGTPPDISPDPQNRPTDGMPEGNSGLDGA